MPDSEFDMGALEQRWRNATVNLSEKQLRRRALYERMPEARRQERRMLKHRLFGLMYGAARTEESDATIREEFEAFEAENERLDALGWPGYAEKEAQDAY